MWPLGLLFSYISLIENDYCAKCKYIMYIQLKIILYGNFVCITLHANGINTFWKFYRDTPQTHLSVSQSARIKCWQLFSTNIYYSLRYSFKIFCVFKLKNKSNCTICSPHFDFKPCQPLRVIIALTRYMYNRKYFSIY